MLKSSKTNLTAQQLINYINSEKITFDSAMQRGKVWDTRRKSLLISSMMEGYHIPPIFASKDTLEKGYVLDCLDGKQRSNAVYDFVNNKFKLSGLESIELLDGTDYDANGKNFGELEKELQDDILGYSFDVYYSENMSDAEKRETFARLNNGKMLTAIELNRVKAISIDKINALSGHELFELFLTKKQKERYIGEDFVIKAWGVLNIPGVSFNAPKIRPLLQTREMSDNEAEEVNGVLDRICSALKIIKSKKSKYADTKTSKKIISFAMKPSHFVGLVVVAKASIQTGVSVAEIVRFIEHFSNMGNKSISEEYNKLSLAGTGKPEVIERRVKIMLNAYIELVGEGGKQ